MCTGLLGAGIFGAADGLACGRLTLTPQDFGVEMQTDEELQAIKEDVEQVVDRMWKEVPSLLRLRLRCERKSVWTV